MFRKKHFWQYWNAVCVRVFSYVLLAKQKVLKTWLCIIWIRTTHVVFKRIGLTAIPIWSTINRVFQRTVTANYFFRLHVYKTIFDCELIYEPYTLSFYYSYEQKRNICWKNQTTKWVLSSRHCVSNENIGKRNSSSFVVVTRCRRVRVVCVVRKK